MNSAEFTCLQEWLGLSDSWLARHFQVKEQSVRRWRTGEHPIPEGIAEGMEGLRRFTERADNAIYEQAKDTRILTVYRNDREYEASGVFPGMSATWHRRICTRIAFDLEDGWRLMFQDSDAWEIAQKERSG